MRTRLQLLLPILGCLAPGGLAPGGLAGQLPVGLAAEASVGYAAPVGDFADAEAGFTAEAGAAFAAGGSVWPIQEFGIFGGYRYTTFGCARCEQFDLDGSAVLKGVEAGIEFASPVAVGIVAPRLRGSLVWQTLGFSRQDERLTSGTETGFAVAAGLPVALAGRLELIPWLRFDSVPAGFTFSNLPDRSVDVTSLTFDVAVAYRF
ncbi:MAG: hypothetical protein WD737_06020 [Gemmatimonadota bacterium]